MDKQDFLTSKHLLELYSQGLSAPEITKAMRKFKHLPSCFTVEGTGQWTPWMTKHYIMQWLGVDFDYVMRRKRAGRVVPIQMEQPGYSEAHRQKTRFMCLKSDIEREHRHDEPKLTTEQLEALVRNALQIENQGSGFTDVTNGLKEVLTFRRGE